MMSATTNCVLVIDDDRDLRETVADLLTMHGFRVEALADGCQGIARLRDASRPRPTLVLLDLMMPVMNGWRVLEEMYGDPALSPIRVVLMSAMTQAPAEPSVEALRARVAAYLRKPFSADDLVRLVAKVTGGVSSGASSSSDPQ
jgi:CheY-like chemotaxis protein